MRAREEAEKCYFRALAEASPLVYRAILDDNDDDEDDDEIDDDDDDDDDSDNDGMVIFSCF